MNLRQKFLAGVLATTIAPLSSQADDWPRFRGPNGTGVSIEKAPLEWSSDQGIKWKVELPGIGVSSPIVVGDRVFVTSYSGYGVPGGGEMKDLKRHLSCFDRSSGKELWTKTVDAKLPEDPYSPPGVTSHGYASHTPVSDGKLVFAFFGKSGVYAYDLDGNEKWHAEVGDGSGPMQWGSAASPIVHKDHVIVTASEESEAIYALDTQTGKEIWKSPAEGLRNTWGTPVIAKGEQGDEVVLSVPVKSGASMLKPASCVGTPEAQATTVPRPVSRSMVM